MDKEQFWQIISESKQETGLNIDNQTQYLIEKLKILPIPDILDFHHYIEEQLALSYTSHLWAVAYIIFGGCSDDSFDYFRRWLIALGKEDFEKGLNNPDSLVIPLEEYSKANIEPTSEDLLYVAIDAYEQGHKKFDFWSELKERYPEKINYPTMVFDWNEEDLETLRIIAPNIYTKFWKW